MQELKDFVKCFLVRAPNRRMGCMQGGVAEVKQHPWFKGFDWDALAARKMRPPYVPKARIWGWHEGGLLPKAHHLCLAAS